MSTVKISQLPPSQNLTGVELIPVVQNATTVKTTVQSVVDLATSQELVVKITVSSNLFNYYNYF